MQKLALLACFAAVMGCGRPVPETSDNINLTVEKTSAVSTDTADLPAAGNKPILGKSPDMPKAVEVSDPPYSVSTLVSGLEVPWDMAFLPGGSILVTERPGRVRMIREGKLAPEPYARIKNANASGEGGLMGIDLHPDYASNKFVYLMYSYQDAGERKNRVSRFTDTGSTLTSEKIIVNNIPGASNHDGGIIRFGPDKMLYIGTGDAAKPETAQDMKSLAGKVLRVTADGKNPADNPFPDSPVYALGLRNVQGLAWHPQTNDLWVTCHGPSYEWGLEAMDAVFVVKPGANCGWPRVWGVTDRKGITPPVLFYPDEAVPPGVAAFYDSDTIPDFKNNFFFASMRSEYLQRVVTEGNKVTKLENWWPGKYGRLRAVRVGPDGYLYVSTTNRDGRGRVRPGDDRILVVKP